MDLRTRLTLEGSDFGNALNDATKQVEDFQKKTEGTSKTVNDMGKATSKTASELLKEMRNMEGLGRSAGNYRQQLSQLTRQISDLTINYRSMSDEMKNSDFGREVASKIDELTQKAGEYKDAIIDAQMSVKALSSDTAGWDAMKGGIDLVSSSMQAFVATGVLGEKTTEDLVAILAKLKAMETVTNAAIKIGNALQKQSALMMGIAKVQSLALARAKAIETTATKGATVAQRVFNAVAKANPYVLLASVIIAVGTALVAFAMKSNEAKKKEEELQKAAEKNVEAFNKWRDAIANSVGDAIGKFTKLQMQWRNLKTDAEKKDWLKDNAKEFENLGLKVNDVNDAEKVLVDNADDVVNALKAKAKAMAMLNLAAEAQADLVKAEIERDKQLERESKMLQFVKAGQYTTDASIKNSWLDMGLRPGEDYKVEQKNFGGYIETRYVLEKAGLDKIKAYRESIANEEVKRQQDNLRRVNEYFDEYTAEAEEAANKIKGFMNNGSGGSGGSGSTLPTYERGSVADYEAQIASLNKKLKEQKLTLKEIKDIQDEIYVLQVKKDLAANGGLIPELKPRSIEQTQSKLKETTLKIPAEIDIDEEDVFDATSNLLGAFGTIQSSIQSIYDTWKGFSESIEGASPFETFINGVSAVLSTLQSITSLMETMNKLGALFNALESASWLIEKKKTEEKMKQTGVNAANLALEEQEAVASATKAAGEAGSSASKIPMVGWIVAIGAIAAIIAAIASAKSSIHFAQGGIVPGSSFSGDKIAASLNSGEMVLNKQQQANLFNLLDNGAPAGGYKVEFVLKGQELHGLLDNYNKKMSRI